MALNHKIVALKDKNTKQGGKKVRHWHNKLDVANRMVPLVRPTLTGGRRTNGDSGVGGNYSVIGAKIQDGSHLFLLPAARQTI